MSDKDGIQFLKSLDPDGLDGTIQIFIMTMQSQGVPLSQVYKKLLSQLSSEKRSLAEDNIRLSKLVNEMGGSIG